MIRTEFHPPKRVLLGPGPSNVEDRVLQAMTAPLLGHLDPLFLNCMTEVQQLLRFVFETENRVTFPVSGTGTAGMDTAMINLIEPDEEVIVCTHGYFGERMHEIAVRVGGKPIRVEAEWGRPIDEKKLKAALEKSGARVVFLVHAETSTGVLHSLEPFSRLIAEREGIFLVDAVTSLGGVPVGVERNRIGVCYSGTQKAIGSPPGLSPITFSELALDKVRKRKTKVPSLYFDVSLIDQYWGGERTYHHTAPISMNYALRESLRIIVEEGLEARWKRHEQNARALWAGVEAMGLELFVPPEHRLPTLTTIKVPDGVSDARVRARLLDEFNIEIGGGLGPIKGKIWRVGLMGAGSTRNNVLLFLSALEHILRSEGVKCDSGVQAAAEVYSSPG